MKEVLTATTEGRAAMEELFIRRTPPCPQTGRRSERIQHAKASGPAENARLTEAQQATFKFMVERNSVSRAMKTLDRQKPSMYTVAAEQQLRLLHPIARPLPQSLQPIALLNEDGAVLSEAQKEQEQKEEEKTFRDQLDKLAKDRLDLSECTKELTSREVWGRLVDSLLTKMDTTASPGPGSLPHSFLSSMIKHRPDLADDLGQRVRALLLGQGPGSATDRAAFTGASLTALAKPGVGKGVRPVAVGLLMRRLTAKMAVTLYRSQTDRFFEKSCLGREHTHAQLGVGGFAGAERVIHSLREVMDEHAEDEDFAILKIDFRNGFNVVNRHAFRKYVGVKFPLIAKWVDYCYGADSKLWWEHIDDLYSQEGAHQGDPLASMLFSIVLKSKCDIHCLNP